MLRGSERAAQACHITGKDFCIARASEPHKRVTSQAGPRSPASRRQAGVGSPAGGCVPTRSSASPGLGRACGRKRIRPGSRWAGQQQPARARARHQREWARGRAVRHQCAISAPARGAGQRNWGPGASRAPARGLRGGSASPPVAAGSAPRGRGCGAVPWSRYMWNAHPVGRSVISGPVAEW